MDSETQETNPLKLSNVNADIIMQVNKFKIQKGRHSIVLSDTNTAWNCFKSVYQTKNNENGSTMEPKRSRLLSLATNTIEDKSVEESEMQEELQIMQAISMFITKL